MWIFSSLLITKKLLQVKGNQVVLLQRKVSCAAKLLESLAYSSDNVDELKKLLETMNDVANDFKGSIPKSEGLILLPSLSTNRVRQIKLKYKKISQEGKEVWRSRTHKKTAWKKEGRPQVSSPSWTESRQNEEGIKLSKNFICATL